MNLSSYILDQAFKQLRVPHSAREQFRIASDLSDVEGRGFPTELFQLSAPVILRGLLNYAILQMKRDWVFPFWVHRQLDPASNSFIPRSQNPLLINVTHRNWTLIGSPHGDHEAIVDPQGLVTPLPREWSVDVWLADSTSIFFPSLAPPCRQQLEPEAPVVETQHDVSGLRLMSRQFVDVTSRDIDVLFAESSVRNDSAHDRTGALIVAIRPFNPEGVAPIRKVEFRTPRQVFVNGVLGLVFAQEPTSFACAGDEDGDLATALRARAAAGNPLLPENRSFASCPTGLAHAVAMFPFALAPGDARSLQYSIALGTEKELAESPVRHPWRVTMSARTEEHRRRWHNELSAGATVVLPDEGLQRLFDSSRLALLQLHDRAFVSPGPYLYHHFWFRDAAPMLLALDRLGFHRRVRQSLDQFADRQTADGFFRGPDGEWDSNGAALWTLAQHYALTQSPLWLRSVIPSVMRGAEWIARKRAASRRTSHTLAGLMPPSLSAEHLGTVDQYYWDSLWSLAGVRSAASLGAEGKDPEKAERFAREAAAFTVALRRSFDEVAVRLGQRLIPATPFRAFDESAIGSVCGIYPLAVSDIDPEAFSNTRDLILRDYIDRKGFYHPFIHSGYNAYLTMQVAHAFLDTGNTDQAWAIAKNIFSLASPTGAFPEAIHPVTGGGAMGDGHHGWAAAEVVLFVRDMLIDDRSERLKVLSAWPRGIELRNKQVTLSDLPTRFGKWSFSLIFEKEDRAVIECRSEFFPGRAPEGIDIHLPFRVQRVLPVSSGQLEEVIDTEDGSIIQCSPAVRRLILQL